MLLGLKDLLKPELVSAGGPACSKPFHSWIQSGQERLHEMSRVFSGVEVSQILVSGVGIPESEGGR